MHTNTYFIFITYKGIMIKTKIKKAIALASITAMLTASLGSSFAATDIGDATVTGSGALTQDIIWDDNFPGTATGTVSGIVVTAEVLPTINMTISADTIDLGVLLAGVESTGSLDIEVGTNAADGVSITARSWSGGLTNTTDNAIQINDLVTDGTAESYTFASAANAIDSTVTGFTTTGDLTAIEVNDNSTEHVVYTTNKPEQDDGTIQDVSFTVAAISNAQTAAGNYRDEITFTITGNF